jgi:hypothetical protein
MLVGRLSKCHSFLHGLELQGLAAARGTHHDPTYLLRHSQCQPACFEHDSA